MVEAFCGINELRLFRKTSFFERIVTAVSGFCVFVSAGTAHYAALNFPPHVLDSVTILGTLQNAWFTAAYFAGTCVMWSGFAEDRIDVRLNATVSPLGISFTIANRLELCYPVIAAFCWLFYKPNSMITV